MPLTGTLPAVPPAQPQGSSSIHHGPGRQLRTGAPHPAVTWAEFFCSSSQPSIASGSATRPAHYSLLLPNPRALPPI